MSPDSRPPGPRGLPVIGNTHQYARDPFGFAERLRDEFGPVARYEVLGRDMYQLNDPEDIEHVLVGHNERYVKGSLFQQLLGPLTGDGLLNSEGATWRRQRHRVQPAFTPDRIAGYADAMTDLTRRTLDDWRDGEVRNVHADAMGLTLRIIAEAMFGIEVDRDVETVGTALETVMVQTEKVWEGLLPEAVPTPGRRRYAAAVASLDEVVYRIIRERKRDPGDDLVSLLLDAEGQDGETMSDRQLRDEVMTILLAGHETTALALTFTVHLLARHPEVERRLVAELDGIDGPPTMADVTGLEYLDRVVRESMRLFPPVPSIVREPTVDETLGGYEVPAGSTLIVHQWTVHRDDRFYDDPLAFDPDRWTDELEASLPRLAYFPFAAGPRRCIGDRFALLEAKLVLAATYRRYHLELVSAPTLELRASLTARPTNPVRMRVHER